MYLGGDTYSRTCFVAGFTQVEERGFAKNTQRCASSRKVLFSVGLSQVEARLIGELCFVDSLMLALIFETSCVPSFLAECPFLVRGTNN